jgi:hypothetical protein
VSLGATLVAMVRVGRPAAAPARVVDVPARSPTCLSDILAKAQVERVLLAGNERWLLTLFVRLLVFWRLPFIRRRTRAHGPAHPRCAPVRDIGSPRRHAAAMREKRATRAAMSMDLDRFRGAQARRGTEVD